MLPPLRGDNPIWEHKQQWHSHATIRQNKHLIAAHSFHFIVSNKAGDSSLHACLGKNMYLQRFGENCLILSFVTMHFFYNLKGGCNSLTYLKTKQILNFYFPHRLQHSCERNALSNVQQIQEKAEKKKKMFSRNCYSHGTQQIAHHKLCLTGAHCNSADIRQPDDSRHKG